MFVLKIIAILTSLWIFYKIITTLNNKIYTKYKHDFFDSDIFWLAFISNVFIYFGHTWYSEALINHADLLNGQIVMGIGGLGLLLLTALNIKSTNFIIGITGSVIQIALFAIASFFTFFILMIIGLWMMETKPVYVINKD